MISGQCTSLAMILLSLRFPRRAEMETVYCLILEACEMVRKHYCDLNCMAYAYLNSQLHSPHDERHFVRNTSGTSPLYRCLGRLRHLEVLN